MKYIEYIDSKNRTTYSSSSSYFTVDLSQTYQNVKSVRLIGYHIANTIYTINEYNNNLRYVENSGNDTISVTLTKKNYTASQLASEIASVMTTNTQNAITYTVSYNSSTMKYTFTADSSNFYFDFNGLNNSCHRQLGFSSTYTGSASSSVTSSNIIRLDHDFILMQTDINNDIKSGNNGKGYASFILQLPTVGTSQFYNTEVIPHSLTYGKSTIDRLEIKLIDTNNNIVNLNGSDNIFIFEFEV